MEFIAGRLASPLKLDTDPLKPPPTDETTFRLNPMEQQYRACRSSLAMSSCGRPMRSSTDAGLPTGSSSTSDPFVCRLGHSPPELGSVYAVVVAASIALPSLETGAAAKIRRSGRRAAAVKMEICLCDVPGPAPVDQGGQRCDGDVARSTQRGKSKARRTRERPVMGSEEGGDHVLLRVEAETYLGGAGP